MQYGIAPSFRPARGTLLATLLLTGLLAGSLAGCASVPKAPLAERLTPNRIAADQSLPGSTQAVWPDEAWWQGHADPQLAALITEGLAASPDVAAAAARLRRADGMAQASGAALLPSLDVQGSPTLNKSSYNNGFPKAFVPKGWQDNGQISAALAFDPDLWGRNRAALAASRSEQRAAMIDAWQARHLLASAVALAYADLARLFEERDIRAAALAMRQTSERLVGNRVSAGVDTRGSLRLAQAQTASARSDLAGAEEALLLRRHQIAALIGAGPDRGLAIARPHYPAAGLRALPANVTTALVARRPDIAIARERVEAAASRIKVARADFYPSVRISALIGMQSLGLENLFDQDSRMGSLGPAISLPLFRGGALQGRYTAASATYDEAVADYDRAVLAAYQQVADAVTSQAALRQRLDDARTALAAAQDAHDIAMRRYQGGLSTYLDVLAVEDRLLQARLAANAIEAAGRTSDIMLIRALGGGYAAASAPDGNLKHD